MTAVTVTRIPPRARRTMDYNQLSSCPDMQHDFVALYQRCRPFTCTSLERMYGLYQAVQHIVDADVAGDFVECGVWKGGSAMLTALLLQQRGVNDRDLWLFDTFDGMTPPGDGDVDFAGRHASAQLAESGRATYGEWFNASIQQVHEAMASTGYPMDRVHLVRGDVMDTLPAAGPRQIALLRLDTDWQASTQHELECLYPRLQRGGVLIVDDYGHWQGCRAAVDRYFREHRVHMLLQRLDYTGRMGVKP